jgi:uncharacterized membrane protein YhaH (DUF805 family)
VRGPTPPAGRHRQRKASTTWGSGRTGPAPSLTFKQAIGAGLTKWLAPNGRASRSKFWHFFLFVQGISFVGIALNEGLLVMLLALYKPLFSVAARRLHDINPSARSLLWAIVRWIGPIVLIARFARPGSPSANQYG